MEKKKKGKICKAFNKVKKFLGWKKKTMPATPTPRRSSSLDIQEMASANGLDRISSLPKEVIGEILKHLTIREAVATSSLSTTWRYKWMSIPEIVFNESCAPKGQTDAQLIKSVDNVLARHDGALTKFELKHYLCITSVDVNRWLMILSKKSLNILNLQPKCILPEMLPASLFLCQDLKELVLRDCGLRLPPRTKLKGFNHLTSLHLKNVEVDKETIEFLVNNSPFLKHLSLDFCSGESTISQLSISASNLEDCDICGHYGDITFVNAPKLKSASLRTWLHASVASCMLDTTLGGLDEIRSLRIRHPLLEILTVDNFWERLPNTCHHLTYVVLDINLEDPRQILATLYLFRCAPSLKSLLIRQDPKQVFNNDLSWEGVYETKQGRREPILQHLSNFMFGDLQGSEKELEFIQFVLLNANVLRCLIVQWETNALSSLVKEKALVKLKQFQRSSSKCSILISDFV